MNKSEIRMQLNFWQTALAKLQEAYTALIDGRAKSYQLDDRQVTKLDLPALSREMERASAKIHELELELEGRGTRRVFAAIPRDW